MLLIKLLSDHSWSTFQQFGTPHHHRYIKKKWKQSKKGLQGGLPEIIDTRSYTSSVTAMLKDLNLRPLDQRRIDSRLNMMSNVTYDLVAIPVSEYLVVRNTRESRDIHSLAYRQIHNLNDYYRFTFVPRTIIYLPIYRFFLPPVPTLVRYCHFGVSPVSYSDYDSDHDTVQQCCLPGDPCEACVSLNTNP